MDIKKIFKYSIEKASSDIHLVAGLAPIVRIDGNLNFVEGEKTISGKDIELSVFSLLTNELKNRFLKEKELDFGYEQDGYRFRVNLHFEKGNVGMVARLINDQISTLENLNFPEVIYRLLNLKQGLILVTGPTGCGKSTSLAAMINHINENRFCNIITFEDPIEYIFKPKKSVTIQRELGNDMHSFADGLKHALRQDPNVIMVGEMRDLETIATTITLAETGHLVFATLHTYSAAQTIARIVDIFPPHQQSQIRMQLSMTLVAVVSQRLLPCEQGGRVAAREIMLNNSAVANLIRENKIPQIKTVIETSSKDGMKSLDQELKRLYLDKKISKEIAVSYMEHPELLKK